MSMPMTEEQIARTAAFYGIDAEEARRRYEIVQAHTSNPEDPICVGCARRPAEMVEFDYLIDGVEAMTEAERAEARRLTCLKEEGTLNPENGHFLCNDDYIRNGQPSSRKGWVCP